MPNRRITQFPVILPPDINDLDLLTLVHVFEIDPALRNKKITFADFRTYLDQYYVNVNEIDPFIAGNVIVSGYLIVSGQADFENIVNFHQDVDFQGAITVSGDISSSGALTVASGISANELNIT